MSDADLRPAAPRASTALQVCWQCRHPLGQSSATEAGAAPITTARYRTRLRGIRPAAGLAILLVFGAGIGAWWYLRPPEPIDLPPRLEREREVNPRLSLQVTELVRDRMDIGVAIARYGRTRDDFPRYAIVAFRDLHPPFTADYLLRDFRAYIPVDTALESELVLARTIDGVRFRCHRARRQENLLAAPRGDLPLVLVATRRRAGILLDRVSRGIRGTLRLAQGARDLVV
jgi:hypothetical protein